MHQTLFKIHWPKGVSCYAPDFRKALAESNSLPSSFFHYGTSIQAKLEVSTADGQKSKEIHTRHFDAAIPLPRRPPIRVVGGRQWVGVLADPDHEAVLLPFIGTLMNVASQIANQAVKVEMLRYDFGIEYTDYPIKYMLREAAIKRRGPKSRESAIDVLLAERIFGAVHENDAYGIDGTCHLFGLEEPSRELLDIKVLPIRNIGLHLKTSNAQSKEYVSLVDAEVWMNAKLKGIWQVGNLIARGYGRLIRPYEKEASQ